MRKISQACYFSNQSLETLFCLNQKLFETTFDIALLLGPPLVKR